MYLQTWWTPQFLTHNMCISGHCELNGFPYTSVSYVKKKKKATKHIMIQNKKNTSCNHNKGPMLLAYLSMYYIIILLWTSPTSTGLMLEHWACTFKLPISHYECLYNMVSTKHLSHIMSYFTKCIVDIMQCTTVFL